MIVVCGEALIDLVPAPDGRERGTPGGGPFTSARALARCLADVTCRLAIDDPIDPLNPADEAQLLNWDAEKYRQSLDQRAP